MPKMHKRKTFVSYMSVSDSNSSVNTVWMTPGNSQPLSTYSTEWKQGGWSITVFMYKCWRIVKDRQDYVVVMNNLKILMTYSNKVYFLSILHGITVSLQLCCMSAACHVHLRLIELQQRTRRTWQSIQWS